MAADVGSVVMRGGFEWKWKKFPAVGVASRSPLLKRLFYNNCMCENTDTMTGWGREFLFSHLFGFWTEIPVFAGILCPKAVSNPNRSVSPPGSKVKFFQKKIKFFFVFSLSVNKIFLSSICLA